VVARQLGLRIATRMGQPVTLVMTRRMLHGIRQHAERRTTAAGSWVRGQLGYPSGSLRQCRESAAGHYRCTADP
jgi:hypothetical protein